MADVAANVPIDRPDIIAQARIAVENFGMGGFPGAIGRAVEQLVARLHQRLDLFVHVAQLMQQLGGIGVIGRPHENMLGAVIGQQVPLGGDAGQGGGMSMGHMADDKEGGLDVQFLQGVQHLFGMGVGAVIKGQGDGMGMGEPGMENGTRLEQRQLRFRGFAATSRDRCRQGEQHAHNKCDFLHTSPLKTSRPNLPTNARAASRAVAKRCG